jgi:hypothetical protein
MTEHGRDVRPDGSNGAGGSVRSRPRARDTRRSPASVSAMPSESSPTRLTGHERRGASARVHRRRRRPRRRARHPGDRCHRPRHTFLRCGCPRPQRRFRLRADRRRPESSTPSPRRASDSPLPVCPGMPSFPSFPRLRSSISVAADGAVTPPTPEEGARQATRAALSSTSVDPVEIRGSIGAGTGARSGSPDSAQRARLLSRSGCPEAPLSQPSWSANSLGTIGTPSGRSVVGSAAALISASTFPSVHNLPSPPCALIREPLAKNTTIAIVATDARLDSGTGDDGWPRGRMPASPVPSSPRTPSTTATRSSASPPAQRDSVRLTSMTLPPASS